MAAMAMLLDCGMSLKDIAECFKLEAKTVERLIVEHQRSQHPRVERAFNRAGGRAMVRSLP